MGRRGGGIFERAKAQMIPAPPHLARSLLQVTQRLRPGPPSPLLLSDASLRTPGDSWLVSLRGGLLRKPFGAWLINGHGKLCQDASCPELVPVVGIGWVQIDAGIAHTQLRDGSLPSRRCY